MTQRQLDRALLAGIGVLLLIILGLALSPAPTAAGDISDPAVRTLQVDAQPTSQPTSRGSDAEAETTPVAPDDAVTNDASTVEENAENVSTEAFSGPEQDAAGIVQPPIRPLAGVPVARVGFAYATGSEGACGVALTAWNYVAVSRDLLEAYPCGTAVTLSFDDEIAGRSSITAQVGDTMGAAITDTVNVFVGEDEPALEYGVTSGTLAQ